MRRYIISLFLSFLFILSKKKKNDASPLPFCSKSSFQTFNIFTNCSGLENIISKLALAFTSNHSSSATILNRAEKQDVGQIALGLTRNPKARALSYVRRNEHSKGKHSFMVENIIFLNHKNQTKMIFWNYYLPDMCSGHMWPAKQDSQAKSSLPPDFVNKVLLTHGQAHLFIYYLWLFSPYITV